MVRLNANVHTAVNKSAQHVIDAAEPHIPQPGSSRGYAVGALKVSGYVMTDSGDRSEYDAAVARAGSAPDTRLLKRGQISDPVVVNPEPGKAKASAAWVPTYAILINSGFHHVSAISRGKDSRITKQPQTGAYIVGVNFAQSAVNETEDVFKKNMIQALKDSQ